MFYILPQDCLIMLFLIGNPYHSLNKIRILVGYTEHPISNRDSDTKCDSDRHLHGKLTLPCNASALHGKVLISCDSDIPISDIPELAWDASSFSESYDYSDSFLGSLDCNSITTHYDFLDTHSEHDFVSHKQNQVKIYPSKIIKR